MNKEKIFDKEDVLSNKLIIADCKGMSREDLEQFADRMRIDRNSFLIDNEKVDKMKKLLERSERELKDARKRNEVQDKYWRNIGVERNSLKKKVEGLELKLQQKEKDYYFNIRNMQMEIVVLENRLKDSNV